MCYTCARMSTEAILWVVFAVIVITILALDLGVFNRRAHAVTLKESLLWSLVWVALAGAFGLIIYLFLGHEPAITYFTGYIIEESLSVDNLFVFLLLFTYFCVPQENRHEVLFWGVIGAIVMRAIFILSGVALFNAFHWIIYVFGAFLVFTGLRMGIKKEGESHPEANPIINFFSRHFPVVKGYRGGKFMVKENGRRYFTPLFLVLLAIETTDIVFAVDSIPAVLSITRDPFIIFTSNMFAVMGLRSIYFALAGFAERLYYLHYGLATILVFLGVKMLISDTPLEVPTIASLGFIALVLIVSVVASMIKTRNMKPKPPEECHNFPDSKK